MTAAYDAQNIWNKYQSCLCKYLHLSLQVIPIFPTWPTAASWFSAGLQSKWSTSLSWLNSYKVTQPSLPPWDLTLTGATSMDMSWLSGLQSQRLGTCGHMCCLAVARACARFHLRLLVLQAHAAMQTSQWTCWRREGPTPSHACFLSLMVKDQTKTPTAMMGGLFSCSKVKTFH